MNLDKIKNACHHSHIKPHQEARVFTERGFGGANKTVLDAGKGNDKIHVHTNLNGSVDVNVNGQNYHFTKEQAKNLEIRGGSGNDCITSSGAALCNKPHITLDGGRGNDFIVGGFGNDTIKGGRGNDILIGGAGNDRISGGRGNDIILGGCGNDIVDGGKGHDAIFGGAGNDFISGGRGNDYIRGEDGHDHVHGGPGKDNVNAGPDMYRILLDNLPAPKF